MRDKELVCNRMRTGISPIVPIAHHPEINLVRTFAFPMQSTMLTHSCVVHNKPLGPHTSFRHRGTRLVNRRDICGYGVKTVKKDGFLRIETTESGQPVNSGPKVAKPLENLWESEAPAELGRQWLGQEPRPPE